jgi:transcriptional regulator with XRE-family HTH domain
VKADLRDFGMATRRDRVSEADRVARIIRSSIGNEIRDARHLAGVSQLVAGRSVGMSHAQFGRIERGRIANVTVAQLSRACASVGMRLSVRVFPAGEPVRDRAQLALLERLRAVIPKPNGWRTEVPMSIDGDLRAWDAVVDCPEGPIAIEAETRLSDVQALERRIALKRRDSRIETVILLVNDTAANRGVLRAYREALRPGFPLDGRDVLRELRRGRRPSASGLLLL